MALPGPGGVVLDVLDVLDVFLGVLLGDAARGGVLGAALGAVLDAARGGVLAALGAVRGGSPGAARSLGRPAFPRVLPERNRAL